MSKKSVIAKGDTHTPYLSAGLYEQLADTAGGQRPVNRFNANQSVFGEVLEGHDVLIELMMQHCFPTRPKENKRKITARAFQLSKRKKNR